MRPTVVRLSAAVLLALLATGANAPLRTSSSTPASTPHNPPPALLIVLAGLGAPPGACLLEDGDFATADGGCKDLATGLVWGQGSGTTGHPLFPPVYAVTWDDAMAYCEASDEAGYTDWFLAPLEQLVELQADGGNAHLNIMSSTGDPGFYYWSSSTRGSQRAWVLSLSAGTSTVLLKGSFTPFVCARVPAPSGPPTAPTGLSATAVSSAQIDLAWTDNADNEDGFQIDRSPDGVSWGTLTTVPPDTTSHSDTGLAASMSYWYRVKAYNSAGDSAYSNVASATTSGGTGGPAVANGEISIDGNVTSGSYLDTHFDDGVLEAIREESTNGNPANRISSLEHKWTINVQGGTGITVQASASSNEEDFDFAWSLTDANDYGDAGHFIGTIIADGSDQTLSFVLPATVSDTVYVRVIDTDRTPGNGDRDTISVDFITITTN